MPTPTAEKLGFYYPLKINAADDEVLDEFDAEAGSDTTNLVNVNLTQADDYWNGAIGYFPEDTATVALRGVYFHVKDFVAAEDKLVLSRPLPAAPDTGTPDTFHLILGGNYRTSQETPLMDKNQPSNVTGVVIDRVAFSNEEGNGTLSYINASQELTWQAPGDSEPGPSVDVSGDGTYIVFSADQAKWIEVTVTSGSLPGSDQSDTIALSEPQGELLPDWEGYESDGAPKTRYHLLVVKNEDGADSMVDAHAYVLPDTPGTPTTLVDGIGTGEESGEVTDASDWPIRSFWVYNVDKDDVRYVKYRSGNVLYYGNPGAGLRGFTAASWDAADDVEVYPEVDIGLDAPSADQFENPANETTAPSGVVFSAPDNYDDGLDLGTLAPGDIYGIWIREHIPAGVFSREAYKSSVTVEWQ